MQWESRVQFKKNIYICVLDKMQALLLFLKKSVCKSCIIFAGKAWRHTAFIQSEETGGDEWNSPLKANKSETGCQNQFKKSTQLQCFQ